MSIPTIATPDESPIKPLHNPLQAAQQPPLTNATNLAGLGAKALLTKKLAAQSGNPAYVSPSDLLLTPCTTKLNMAKKKHFNKGKPIQFAFAQQTPAAATVTSTSSASSLEVESSPETDVVIVVDGEHAAESEKMDVEENPFQL